MHEALLIPDLVASICDAVDGKEDAYSMARTCRAWQHPAVDRIWRDMTLEQLCLQVLPSDVLYQEETNSTTTWCRSPQPADYEKLYEYSQRVRNLRVDTSSDTCLRTICSHPPPRPLFPQLKILSITLPLTMRRVDQTLLAPFSSPVLIKLVVQAREPEGLDDLEDILPSIDLDAIWLMYGPEVRLHIDLSDYSSMRALVGTHRDIIHTVVLHQIPLDENDWRFLTALPRLHAFRIEAPPEMPPLRVGTVDCPSHALTELHISAWDDCRPLVTDLLRQCGCLSLSTVVIIIKYDHRDGERTRTNHWTHLLRALQRHCVHDSMRTLRLESRSEMKKIYFDDLKLLLPFTQLTTLHVVNKGGVSVRDRHITQLMHSWKSLRSLRLASAIYDSLDVSDTPSSDMCCAPHVYACSIIGLLDLVESATSLVSLNISIDFDDRFFKDFQRRQPNTGIRHLNFCGSIIDDPFEVAEVLLHMFPNVVAGAGHITASTWQNVEHYEGCLGDTMWEKWEQVQRIVGLLREAERNIEQRVRRTLTGGQ